MLQQEGHLHFGQQQQEGHLCLGQQQEDHFRLRQQQEGHLCLGQQQEGHLCLGQEKEAIFYFFVCVLSIYEKRKGDIKFIGRRSDTIDIGQG